MRRHSDCEITEFKIRAAIEEAQDGHIVDEAMRDILAGKFESRAVMAVMGRRAGSIHDYIKVKKEYEIAALAARHCGVQT